MRSTMRRLLLTSLLVFPLLSVTACDSWEADSSYEYPVFSEDGASIAAVYMTFESKDNVTHTARRNFQSQLLMRSSLSSGQFQAMTPLRDGQVVDLFFMSEEEYMVIGRRGAEADQGDGSRTATITYEKVTVDGTSTDLGNVTTTTMLSCDGGSSSAGLPLPLQFMPSPDGSVLAKYEAQTSCTSRTQTLTFIDALTLAVIRGPVTLTEPNMPLLPGGYWPMTDIAWRADGRLAVAYWGNFSEPDMLNATVYSVDGTVEEVAMHHGCFYPKTSSSDVRADGAYVSLDGQSGEVNITPNGFNGMPMNNTFGCP